MSKISNLNYAALNLSGHNYLQWGLDTKINLRSKELCDTIIKGNNEIDKNRYDHQKTVLLPKARHEWKNLRFMDYKSVDEYNLVLFKIVSMMRLCGEEVTEKELLDKTFSTFHSTNVLLQQQYRERGFASYTDLILCLLLAEANNELLMKNSEMRPTGTSALPEANEAEKKDPKECNHVHDNKKSHGKGRSRFKGRGHDSYGRQRNHNNRGRGSSRGRGNYGRGRESLKNKNPEARMVHDTGYDADDDSDLERDDLLDFETSDCLKD
ncbi:uncharacterized protein LOC106433736 [Brassica napus]|uniref:uncharacterized protein LOC106433736 n=1 Tax=Brassica napus TaxID=3708 RepID=UPI002079AEF8|nr:uncharacterized protein LOC106433736 [Brassica napus]